MHSTNLSRALSPTEAARAIYVDFEGSRGDGPSLLGYSYDLDTTGSAVGRRVVQQVVLEEALAPLAAETHLKVPGYGCRAESVDAAIDTLATLAIAQDRAIVSWDRRELDVVQRYCAPVVADRFELQHREARGTAAKWLGQCRPETATAWELERCGHRLPRYLDVIGYGVPGAYGPGKAGSRIRDLRTALERRDGDTGRLTHGQHRTWTNLLWHNYHDVDGMRAVVQRAARSYAIDLAKAGR